jgi:type I restriction enzyme S subunit
VDELMAWCDELEALKQKRDALQKAALKASLNQLSTTRFARGTEGMSLDHTDSLCLSGLCGEKFHALEHLSALIRNPADIKQLRDAILQLAVQGRLVPQRKEDGTAADLLKQIEAAKAADLERRKAAGERIRKTKVLPPIEPNEAPFDIPENWEWVRIRSIFSDVGQKVPDQKFCYVDVSAINKERGVVMADAVKVLESADAPSRARKLVCKGSVIYSTVRPYLLNIAMIEDDFELEPVVSTAFAVLKPWAGTSEKLLYYYLRSPAFTEYVESKQKGVAYPAISESEFNIGIYPLPPLAEQQRIVKKVDELMAFCDKLETLLQTQSDTATRFAAAVARSSGPCA